MENYGMHSYDMVVIGAGPAGSMAALIAADRGLETLLVERDPVVGTPVRCAEGIDHIGLSHFFEPNPVWISAYIDKYYLVSPDGDYVEMNTDGNIGYILDRSVFDKMIAVQALNKGAKVMTGVEAVGMTEHENGTRRVSLRDDGNEWDVEAKVVIAADGVESRVARWAGIDTTCPVHDMETCAQMVLSGIEIDNRAFSLHFTREFAPGGYAWVFPKGSDSANVGLGISGDIAKDKPPVKFLDDYIQRYFPDATVKSRTIGGIQCSGGLKRIVADGFMVCGDAAHMANPITGGGIINAMIAGRAAAVTASKALRNGSVAAKNLKEYQKICDDRFGKMNRLFYRVKEGIISIPDKRFNAIAREALALPIEKRTPVRILAAALLKNPALLKILPRLVI